MDILEFIVTELEKGSRLDKYCNEMIEDCSRNRIQQLIDEGCILVNDQPSRSNYRVRINDCITCEMPENKELVALPQEMELDIVYEDSDLIVINKPKGMVVHPGAGNPENTLVNGLLFHCKDLSGINGVIRPGIVHRIDKDTSGLLVVAKNDKAHEALSRQLAKKTAHRKYLALIHGNLTHEYGTIDAPIGRDKKDRQKMAVTNMNARDAKTHFKVKERFGDYTLVECSLETGRTHQIRVHMHYIGFPIVGDPKYGMAKSMKTNGQLLHAYELTFIHPSTKESMTFNAEIPKEFEDVLTELRKGR